MLDTIDAVCSELHNYFDERKRIDDYTIEDGRITLPFLVDGQYFRIVGSKFNDGVYIYHETPAEDDPELTDEVFHGAIWSMRMSKAFLKLCADIKTYIESDAAQASPYLSENISGFYSYTKANVNDTAWQNVFKNRLAAYRKVANLNGSDRF